MTKDSNRTTSHDSGMSSGLIIKAISGFFDVQLIPDHKIIRCRGKGLLKRKEVVPTVGDHVIIERDGDIGMVKEVLPRSTLLIRPGVANAEVAVVVMSMSNPEPQPVLTDKILVHACRAGLNGMVVLNKQDEADPTYWTDELLQEWEKRYRSAGYSFWLTSVHDRSSVDALSHAINNKIAVMCGASGVGKSALLKAMLPDQDIEVGAISFKGGRGKHTTRHVELLRLPSGGWVVDTPGFSQLDFNTWECSELGHAFPEIANFPAKCHFRGCSHLQEPGCAILEALQDGRIDRQRYKHYQMFMQEIKEQKRRY